MTDEAALEALDWLEAHHGKPVTVASCTHSPSRPVRASTMRLQHAIRQTRESKRSKTEGPSPFAT